MNDEPKWDRWRGSPEHLAQIARVALEAVDGEATKTGYIALGCRGYRQTFDPAAFTKEATPEALRDCRRIVIGAIGQDLRVQVRFRTGTNRHTKKHPKKAGVRLRVRSSQGPNDPRRSRIARKVTAAIDRGRVPKWQDILARSAILVISALVFLATGWSLEVLAPYVTDLADESGFAAETAGQAMGMATEATWTAAGWVIPLLFALATQLLLPSVELAQFGQTRLARYTKVLGPWFAGIIAAGIGKAVFG